MTNLGSDGQGSDHQGERTQTEEQGATADVDVGNKSSKFGEDVIIVLVGATIGDCELMGARRAGYGHLRQDSQKIVHER
ncbi:MAG: hypothetical protein ACREOG_01940 [Gemmatimonadaceae bacterium]